MEKPEKCSVLVIILLHMNTILELNLTLPQGA